MDAWEETEAEKHLGRLIDTAAAQGPQIVMRSAVPAAVVLSHGAYEALRRQADRQFADFLIASPMEPEDFDSGIGMSPTDDA